ncbi:hypothetical protein [Endozoicomonas sp.]|uniref:hypothetical protein n=1 Tax=Endozoicomonas sp. TaxID=1892382 RepID=UPI002883CC34|nr:hypothetical protein [Endozoicomonas sp.]
MTRTLLKTLLNFLSVTLITVMLPFTAKVAANDSSREIQRADGTIMIPVGSQSHQLRQSLSLPEHGQTMEMVKEMLGVPQKTDVIGEPVITRWHYPEHNLTIYFESNRVLRSVVNNTPQL